MRGKRETKKDVRILYLRVGDTPGRGGIGKRRSTCTTVPNPSRESETARVKVVSLFKRAEEKVRYSIKLFGTSPFFPCIH